MTPAERMQSQYTSKTTKPILNGHDTAAAGGRYQQTGSKQPPAWAELCSPNQRKGNWLVRPDGYIACSSTKPEDIAQYLSDLAIV